MKSYCNPLNICYRFIRSDRGAKESCREGSDPALVFFDGKYFLATSKTSGLHWSDDLQSWHFIPSKVLPAEGYGPDLWIRNGRLHYVNGLGEGQIFRAIDVFADQWEVVGRIGSLADPKIFADDDGRNFLYHGCAVMAPLRGRELNSKTAEPMTYEVSFNAPDPAHQGWARSGENNRPTSDTLDGLEIFHPDYEHYVPETWNEGAWMTKHNGKYYLQNSGPATEFNIYSDSISVGDRPLGPFEFQRDNPLSLKPGGFITGAGHSCTFTDRHENFFHVSTMRISRNFIYERRIGMFPTGFYEDGTMFCRTRFGDYPHRVPDHHLAPGEDSFCDWMLQSYRCRIRASGEEPGHEAVHAVDEDIRTYWAAAPDDSRPELFLDLEMPTEVYAIQLNFAEHNCCRYADQSPQGCVQFILEDAAKQGEWRLRWDRSQNKEDKTHCYLALDRPVWVRYLRIRILAMANGGIPAMSGIRIFGHAAVAAPATPRNIKIRRRADDPMTADISWEMPDGAFGVNVLWGLSPDRLHHCWQVLEKEELVLTSLDASTQYYVALEAFGRGGTAPLSEPVFI